MSNLCCREVRCKYLSRFRELCPGLYEIFLIEEDLSVFISDLDNALKRSKWGGVVNVFSS